MAVTVESMGRKRKTPSEEPTGQTTGKTTTVRVSDETAGMITFVAKKRGVSTAEYVDSLILDDLRADYREQLKMESDRLDN